MESIFKQGKQSVYLRGDEIPVAGTVNYIKSGALALYSCENEKRNFLFAYKAGEIFPYIKMQASFLSGKKLEYRALSTVTTLSVPRKDFEAEAFKPENIRLFVENLMELMEFQIERIENLEQGQVFNRLLGRLVFFAKRLGIEHGDRVVVDAPMSYGDLATSIGTTRETVNRLMKKLEKSGVISVKKQTIIINSLNDLSQMIGSDNEANRRKGFLMTAGLAAIVAELVINYLPSSY